jgi:hypothetical protein
MSSIEELLNRFRAVIETQYGVTRETGGNSDGIRIPERRSPWQNHPLF